MGVTALVFKNKRGSTSAIFRMFGVVSSKPHEKGNPFFHMGNKHVADEIPVLLIHAKTDLQVASTPN